MEKAFAYICASEEAAPRLLKRYCRKVYELGYIPICPRLSDGQYLALEIPDEKRTFYSIDGAGCWWCAEMKSARR